MRHFNLLLGVGFGAGHGAIIAPATAQLGRRCASTIASATAHCSGITLAPLCVGFVGFW